MKKTGAESAAERFEKPSAEGRGRGFAARRGELIGKSLRDQNAFIETVLASVRDWVLVTDLSFRLVRANEMAVGELGTEEGALVHRPLGALLEGIEPPESFTLAVEQCSAPRIARSFSALVSGLPYRRRFSIRPLLDESGRYGFLVTGGAPSECGEGDEGRAVMNLAQRILDGLDLPVLLIDLATRTILEGNERFCLLFGRERGEFLGASSRILFRDEADYLRYRDDVDYDFRRTGLHVAERPFYKATGEALLCRLTVLPFFLPGAQGSYAVCLFEDRSVERRREEHIAALVGELDKATSGLVAAYRRKERSADQPRSLGDFGASRRQIEIGRLVSAGSSTKEISRELGLAESTVKNHLVALYKKLGVSNRVEFAKAVAERGILLL